MSHDYSVELGFDLDSYSKEAAYQGFLEMACQDGGNLASMDQMKKDGNLTFIVYDTSEGTNSGKATPQSLTVAFAAADAASGATSPFSSSSLTFTSFHNRGTKGSSEFGSCPSWYAQSGAEVGTDKPTSFSFANSGHFFVTVSLQVTYPDGSTPPQTLTKTFGQDPRMNVDT